MKIRIVQGDITEQAVDAIVNAANTGLWGGGGVDGAIHRAAGPELAKECARLRESCGGCPTGQAVITKGYNLKAKHVIHTVGPVWQGGGNNEAELLAECYRNALMLAEANSVHTIAFPSISTGVYAYPIDQAAKVAFATVRAHKPTSIREAVFVLFSAGDFEVYEALVEGCK